MAQRGFTLFTALVAFILIVLSLLLVQSMISTERTTSDIISDISEQEEMQAIADLSRADALQVFNFGIRDSIEEFSTHDDDKDGVPENDYVVFPSDAATWDELKKSFVKDRFGVGDASNNQFAIRAAGHLISLLETTDDARGFDIELVKPDQATMSQVLKRTFERQAQKSGEEFFEVIKCGPTLPDHYKDCIGSFYVTMDLSQQAMEDAQYEKFPQVKVQNVQTGRILKEPILPRGKFRIYVPTRLFKALAGSYALARAGGGGVFDSGFYTGIPQSKDGAKQFIIDRLEPRIAQLGLKTDSGGFALKNYEVVTASTGTGEADDPEKLVSFRVRLFFEDGNDKYKVSSKGTDEKGGPNVYVITLVQQFN